MPLISQNLELPAVVHTKPAPGHGLRKKKGIKSGNLPLISYFTLNW